MAKSDVK
ncbi:hypothetical protein CISIN_1g0401202mg, partial [Citrus sinensis]